MMDGNFHDMMQRTAMMLALAAVLAVGAGCPTDDSASMAKQMATARPGATAASQTQRGSEQPATTDPDAAAAAPAAPAEAADPAAADAEAGPYDGPKVIIDQLSVVIKAPYPEFTGAGRYNISFKSELEEAHPAGVWQLRALNATGELVGSVEQFLTLSYGWQKPLDFKGLYCSEMPTSVEMWLTDKQPAKPSTVEEEGQQQGGAEGGGMEGSAGGEEEEGEGEEEGEEDGGRGGVAGLG